MIEKLFPLWLTIACCWYITDTPAGDRAIMMAEPYVGHVEFTHNSSPFIDYINGRMGLPPGTNYCATFAAYILDSAKVEFPAVRSAVAQHYIIRESIPARDVMTGARTVPVGSLAIWRRGDTWMGHVEFVREEWTGPDGKTIGANTSPGDVGSQANGNGIWARDRRIIPTAYFRITHFTETR